MLTVLGNTTVDIVVRGLEQLPGNGAQGEQLLLTRERVSPSLGGSGARSAYAGAALGELTRLWSAVGGDSLGELALNWLEGRKVDTTSVRISGEAGTSTNIVLADAQANTQTIHYPGASSIFTPRARSMSGGPTDWLLVTGYALLPGWRGGNALELLRNAQRSRINTALDFGTFPAAPVTKSEIGSILPHLQLLLCSRDAIEEATGLSVDDGARWAVHAGAAVVVVKLPEGGAFVFTGDAVEGLKVPAFPESQAAAANVEDASDTFNAAFLYERNRGATLEDSARFANAAATLVRKAQRGVLDAPNEDAVRAFITKQGD